MKKWIVRSFTQKWSEWFLQQVSPAHIVTYWMDQWRSRPMNCHTITWAWSTRTVNCVKEQVIMSWRFTFDQQSSLWQHNMFNNIQQLSALCQITSYHATRWYSMAKCRLVCLCCDLKLWSHDLKNSKSVQRICIFGLYGAIQMLLLLFSMFGLAVTLTFDPRM